MAKRQFWHYCFSDWIGTFGWMGLIISGGIAGGLWLAFPDQLVWTLALVALPLFVPLILQRQEARIDPASGELELTCGLWPSPRRIKYGPGELRWVYMSGAGNYLSSWVSMGVEDRTGRRYRLCTENQERIQHLEAEAEVLARTLGVVVYARPSFHDARRRIYSGRRQRLSASLELALAGLALGAFALMVRAGAITFPGAAGAAISLAMGFASITFLVVSVPLMVENAAAAPQLIESVHRVTDRWRRSV